MSLSSNAVTVTVVLPGAPTWFTSMVDKRWTTVATGGLLPVLQDQALIPAGHGAVTITNNTMGAAVLGTEIILPANGGHADYAGNEVYALNLGVATPAWARLTNSTQTAQIVQNGAGGAYLDGRPASTHNWHRPAGGNGKVCLGMMEATWGPNGNPFNDAFLFDRASLTWTALGKVLPAQGDQLAGGYQAGCSAYDSVSQKFYNMLAKSADFAPMSWTIDSNTGAKATLGLPVISRDFRACAIASDLRIWALIAPGQSRIEVADLSGAMTSWGTPTISGTVPSDGAGMCYHQPSRSFLCWNNQGATITKIKIPANPLTGQYVITTINPDAGNTIVPPGGLNAAYNQFNIIPDMGNGQAALVIVRGAYNAPSYVYKLPTTELL